MEKNILELPNEILMDIFSNLRKHEFFNVALCCRTLYELIMSEAFFKQCCVKLLLAVGRRNVSSRSAFHEIQERMVIGEMKCVRPYWVPFALKDFLEAKPLPDAFRASLVLDDSHEGY